MRIPKSKALAMVSAVLVLSSLVLSLFALSPLARGDDAQLVVPMGALARAAATLERSTGGRILEIRVANAAGPPAFEAAVAKNGAVLYLRVGSPSDDVTEIEVSALPSWLLNYRLEAYMRSAEKAEIPLDQAILRAEAREAAPATGAGIAKPLGGNNAVLAYFVETVKGSKREVLAVDAKSGAFIANPEDLYELPTPVELARRIAP